MPKYVMVGGSCGWDVGEIQDDGTVLAIAQVRPHGRVKGRDMDSWGQETAARIVAAMNWATEMAST